MILTPATVEENYVVSFDLSKGRPNNVMLRMTVETMTPSITLLSDGLTVRKEERGVYTAMDRWVRIRPNVWRGKKTKRENLREEEIHWEILKGYSEPPLGIV